MNKYIALLRGINVGGNKKILMTDLKAMFEQLNYQNVQHYIQSGNIIFENQKTTSTLVLANEIERSITDTFGFDVPVIVITREELSEAVLQNPYYNAGQENIDRLHLTFLKTLPSYENVLKAQTYNYPPDKFEIKSKNVYLFCAGKYHETKYGNSFFESKLKVAATTRNWKTVLKLSELCKI